MYLTTAPYWTRIISKLNSHTDKKQILCPEPETLDIANLHVEPDMLCVGLSQIFVDDVGYEGADDGDGRHDDKGGDVEGALLVKECGEGHAGRPEGDHCCHHNFEPLVHSKATECELEPVAAAAPVCVFS